MEIDDVDRVIQEEFERFATQTCVNTLKNCAAAQIKDNTNGLTGSISAERRSDTEYWVGTHCGYGAVVNNGRKAVKPLGKPKGADFLQFRDGSFHKYSSAFRGYHFVEIAVRLLGGS